MTRFIFRELVLSFLLSRVPDALGGDDPNMERALDLLRSALSTKGTPGNNP